MATGNPGYQSLALNEGVGGAQPPAYNESAPSAPADNPAATSQAPQYNQVQHVNKHGQRIGYVDKYGNPVTPPPEPFVDSSSSDDPNWEDRRDLNKIQTVIIENGRYRKGKRIATQPVVQQQVVYQEPAQQGQQQVLYVNQYGQPIQSPTQQGQPQVVYVQQQQPQTQQPIIINNNTTQQSTQQATQQNVVVAQTYQRERPDDPSCLYILACFGFFFWPIGAIGMCIYNCGSNLPPRQAQAFKILVALTLLGVVINIIYYVAAQ